MAQHAGNRRFPSIGDGSGLAHSDRLYREELSLAARNRGMPLEALRDPITPTGLHYLLVHFDIPAVEAESWRLEIAGLVANPLRLSLDEIKARPAVTIPVTMECAGNGRALLRPRPISQPWLLEAIGTAEWTGTPLRDLLAEAGVSAHAVELLFTGLDRGVQGNEVQWYQRSLSLREATREEVLLAYQMNGVPLPPQHGSPLRLIVPGWYGMASVKWLTCIEAIGEPFHGYQMEQTYRYADSADAPGEPVTYIQVRALMMPPGIPDFMTRTRLLDAGPVRLLGRAWAGRLGVSRVEVSIDGGSTWSEAHLGVPVSPWAWRMWSWAWEARSGRYTVCVRATDTEGHVQPLAQPWNYQGMGNNMVQRVEVIVE
jgi:DMSO/TMAO reductase YedYZ molybdopterin-dependent catalytic subunit